MGLRLAGATGTAEEVEPILYQPGLQDSGDLESATKTITAASKQGDPDYTTSLSVATPPSALTVLRLGLRLQVTIDSFGGAPSATQLSYSVEVNGAQRAAGAWTATGARYAVADLTSGQHNLGTANAIKLYLWVDQGIAVVSLCQIWLGVGTTQAAASWGREVLKVAHHGFAQFSFAINRQGTGSYDVRVMSPDLIASDEAVIYSASASGTQLVRGLLGLIASAAIRLMNGTVNTDLLTLPFFGTILRREE